jgi:aspartyl-tRNA(Asn)/glutamyl-tRNA(Gln) amidotransferase subunit B
MSDAWEAVIGLEVHAQLRTASKLFSPCPVASAPDRAAEDAAESPDAGLAWAEDEEAEPNLALDPVTLGLPGTLPVPNAEAVRLAVRLGLALGCEIDPASRFDRKHYTYPDLPRGYQITQLHRPICRGGAVPLGDGRVARLARIHLEEDAGKTIHDARAGLSRVDYTRAGVALVEIVGEPDLRSPEEAVTYLKRLHQLVTWLGVCDGHMARGNFRCDANVSVRRPGGPLGTRTEIKNVNSFRFVERAIASEIARQIALLEGGGRVLQETRGWDEATGRTRPLRSKEEAHDYRYFPDPDMGPIRLAPAFIAAEREALPELPLARAQRYEGLGLSPADADTLTQSPERGAFFEAVAARGGDPKLAANWVINDLFGALARAGRDLSASPVGADALGDLVTLLREGRLNSRLAKQCFSAMWDAPAGVPVSPRAWADAMGGQLHDEGALTAAIDGVLDRSTAQVAQWLEGRDKVLGYLVGQVMRETKGRAAPDALNRLLLARLEARRPA